MPAICWFCRSLCFVFRNWKALKKVTFLCFEKISCCFCDMSWVIIHLQREALSFSCNISLNLSNKSGPTQLRINPATSISIRIINKDQWLSSTGSLPSLYFSTHQVNHHFVCLSFSRTGQAFLHLIWPNLVVILCIYIHSATSSSWRLFLTWHQRQVIQLKPSSVVVQALWWAGQWTASDVLPSLSLGFNGSAPFGPHTDRSIE